MRLNKKKRQVIFDKTNGRCWYCGCELDDKWHADHVEPVIRIYGGGMLRPQNDTDENLVPACHPCNLHKHSADLENYRRIITEGREQFIRSGKGKALLRMGLATISDAPVVFWGEQ
jgi:5-methylcytosine-specific restriction endonuclease McrA